MATKRMIYTQIVDSDAFLNMPASTQNLYFHLNLRADDDGFVDSPRKIMKIVGASEDDMRILLSKRYLLTFDSGIIVIKHWRLHNTIQKDRYKPTLYKEEMQQLHVKENGAYTDNKAMLTECIQPGSKMLHRLDQISIDKDSIEKPQPQRFIKPKVEEVKAYLKERGITSFKADQFYDYYESKGWMIGKNHMKDWKAAVRTWEKNDINKGKEPVKINTYVPEFVPENERADPEQVKGLREKLGIR